ncbi:hypothetical protein [Ammoniphilus sp. YIM 78166]|uniref:hypothetical protein n=1 Tax=Ammoniphilus sp. YIM 78166 TaxID=1644106 RepID=UPI00106FB4A6|nr:hypothetical protein [Ammoniphilus sp. YIM 78166]
MNRWSLPFIFGSVAFLFTFISSIGNNTWMTSIVRSTLGFVIFFVCMLVIRWFFLQIPRKNSDTKRDEEGVGVRVNAETPEEDLLGQMGSYSAEGPGAKPEYSTFTPLSPPVVKKKSAANNPEDIANAIRVLSNQ